MDPAGRMGGDPNDLLDLVARGLIELRFDLSREVERVRALMKRYRSVPMSLADACLVRMSEQTPACRVVTLDHDFRIYDRHDRRPIPVLMPDNLWPDAQCATVTVHVHRDTHSFALASSEVITEARIILSL